MEEFVEKLQEKIVNEVVEFQLFADIGIHALSEAIDWLNESIENCETNSWSKKSINNVIRDANRLLSTYKDKVESKIEYCEFEGDEKNECKKLGKTLTDSLSQLSRNQNAGKLRNIQNNAHELLKFLEKLQDKLREDIIKKIEHETTSLKNRIVEAGKISESTSITEKVENTLVDRNDDLLKSLITEFREFKQTNEQKVNELKKQCEKLKNHSGNSFDSEPKTTKGTVATIYPTVLESNTSTVGSHWKKIITGKINNISKRDEQIISFQSFTFRDKPWEVCYQWDTEYLKMWFMCESEDFSGYSYCIVTSEVSIRNQFNTGKCYKDKQTSEVFACFATPHKIRIEELTKPENGYVKDDSIVLELDITLLSCSGCSTSQSYFLNPCYEQTTGTVDSVTPSSYFWRNDTLYSTMSTIEEYSWRLEVTQNELYLNCATDCSPEWACSAKIEFRLTNREFSTSEQLKTTAFEFDNNKTRLAFQNLDLRRINYQKKTNFNIMDILAVVTIFKRKVY